jgi:5-oxoprolinase (ATP-hydrolysing) subunit C
VIRVVTVTGLATVQDAGRPGRMHEGIPPGGALVPERLAIANAAAHNAPGEAGVEVFGTITFAAVQPVFVAADDSGGRWLAAGEAWSVATAGARVRYVAVRGGVDVPVVLGGRGTLLAGGFGGHEGRPLRRGDTLRAGGAPVDGVRVRGASAHGHQGQREAERRSGSGKAPRYASAAEIGAETERRSGSELALDPDPIRLVPGPDIDRFAPEALGILLGSPFEIAPQSDRVGVRLRGPTLPRAGHDSGVSAPMVRGAIQVPLAGEPIVLGPDHPTTGGYPVLATITRADLGALLARPLGATVRFSLARHASGGLGIDPQLP